MSQSLSLASYVYFNRVSYSPSWPLTHYVAREDWISNPTSASQAAYIPTQDFIEPWELKPMLPTDNTMVFPDKNICSLFCLSVFFLSPETLYYFPSDRGAIPLKTLSLWLARPNLPASSLHPPIRASAIKASACPSAHGVSLPYVKHRWASLETARTSLLTLPTGHHHTPALGLSLLCQPGLHPAG